MTYVDDEHSSWKPDRRTVTWISGILHEERIVDSLREEVRDRNTSPVGSREYWLLVASIAVEHISFDIARRVDRWYAELDSHERRTRGDRG